MGKGKLTRLLGKSISKIGKGMAGLGKLAVDQVDPEKNEGFLLAAKTVESIIRSQKHSFDWESACDGIHARKSERIALAKLIYKRAIRRVWADAVLSDSEQKYLDWLIQRLPLDQKQCAKVRLDEERRVFSMVMYEVLHDGKVDKDEQSRLLALAANMGSSLNELVVEYFNERGTAFFGDKMEQLIHRRDGGIEEMEREWNCLLESSKALTLDREQLLQITNNCAVQLLEHVIVDAKADDRLWEHEERAIRWVCKTFELKQEFLNYAEDEMQSLRILGDIIQGKLPSISHDEVEADLNPGELVHFISQDCTMERIRNLKSGQRVDSFVGEFLITDTRYIFISWDDDYQESKPHRSILRKTNFNGGFRIGLKNGSLIFRIDDEVKFAHKIFDMAIGLCKGRIPQSIQDDQDFRPTRHVSRDVRQKVWTQYGGKCVDCGSTHYLEYDHIIPHAKGGSNELENIQLLCRGCNLKKSDRI
jgi:hypothetical protein